MKISKNKLIVLVFMGGLIGLPILGMRLLVRKALESAEILQEAQSFANQTLGPMGLKVDLPKVKTTGFIDFDMDPITLSSVQNAPQNAPLGTLGLRIKVDGFPWALLGRKLSLVGQLGETLGDSSKNTLEFKAAPGLKGLLNLNKILAAKSQGGTLGGITELLGEIQVDIKNVEQRFIKEKWPSMQSIFNARLTGGVVSGQILALKDPQETLKIRLNLGAAQWASPLFEKATIKTAPTTFEGHLDGQELRFTSPLDLKIEIEGGVQALLIKKTWTMSLSDRITWKPQGADYNLQVRVTGGPLALLAAGRLLRCRLPPMRESFRVEGPASQPDCR